MPRDDAEEESGCRSSPPATRSTRDELEPKGHETSPPARYTEASLVKALEERGIGRPSTYASIMATIQDRGYVRKQGTRWCPTFTRVRGRQAARAALPPLVDYEFTARMEDDLDEIAGGDESAPVAPSLLLRRRRRRTTVSRRSSSCISATSMRGRSIPS